MEGVQEKRDVGCGVGRESEVGDVIYGFFVCVSRVCYDSIACQKESLSVYLRLIRTPNT